MNARRRRKTTSDASSLGRSRRTFLKTGFGLVGGAALGTSASPLSAQSRPQDAAAIRDRLERRTRDPRGRILIKGATIISMDPQVGDFAKADLLVEGKKIIDVKPDIKVSAEVLDATGTIMLPGFADTHRHAFGVFWTLEGLSQEPFTAQPSPIRRLAGAPAPADGSARARGLLNSQIQPDDIYAATLVTALTCIKSGITCEMDWSGNSRTPEHADAAIQALFDSGVRAVHGYGEPNSGSSRVPQDLARIQKKFFSSSDQLVTLYLAMNIRSPENETIARIQFARDHGLRMTIDGADWPEQGETIVRLGNAGHLGPDITFVHVNDIGDAAWKVLAGTGATVSLAAFSEPLIGIANGIPAVQSAVNVGIRPSLSADVFQFSDFFTIMRMALCFQRQHAFESWYNGDRNPPRPVTMRDVLDFSTVQGVKANGLLDKCGTLTPGKEADLILIRADDVNTVTLPNALAAVVMAGDTSNVDTVMIGGKLKKFRGELAAADEKRATRLYQQSRDKIFARAGYKLDALK